MAAIKIKTALNVMPTPLPEYRRMMAGQRLASPRGTWRPVSTSRPIPSALPTRHGGICVQRI